MELGPKKTPALSAWELPALIGAGLLLVTLAICFWFVCDDAFISFRYARNLAEGHGLRYNLGVDPPVEGYSNFLWVVLGAAIFKFGLPIEIVLPIVSLISAVVLLSGVWATLRIRMGLNPASAMAAAYSLAIFPPMAVWSSSGLAAMPVALSLFGLYYFLVLSSAKHAGWLAGLSGVFLVLLRVEGILWFSLLAVLVLVFGTQPKKRLVQCLMIVGAAFVSYFLWRWQYYQELLPNTVTNKVSFSELVLIRGGKYALLYLLTFLTPLMIPFGLWAWVRAQRWQSVSGVLLTLALVAYPIAVGGDFMAMGRFFVPLLPFQAVCFGFLIDYLLNKRWRKVVSCLIGVVILLSIAPTFNLHLVPKGVRRQLHFRLNTPVFRSEFEQWAYMRDNSERWQYLGRGLRLHAKPGESLVAGAIGNVGYYSGLYIYDRFGLVEARVARQAARLNQRSPGHEKMVLPQFFLNDRPTYLKAHLLRLPSMASRVVATKDKWQKNKLFSDYEPHYVELPWRDSKGSKLAMLLLKRKQSNLN